MTKAENSHLNQAVLDRLQSDKQMFIILLLHFPVTAFIVPIGYGTSTFAIIASLLVVALSAAGYWFLKGTRAASCIFGIGLMLYSAVMIQAQLGRIEMHFHIFAALALLTIYRDWLPVVVAAGTIAVHHLLLTALQLGELSLGDMPIMVYNYGCSWGITFLHAAFVVFEAAILVFFAVRLAADQAQAYKMLDIVHAFSAKDELHTRLEGETVSAVAFNNMLNQFSDLIGRLREMSKLLSQNSESLAQVSRTTEQIVDQQHQEMEQAAAATNEMSASIQEVASNAQTASGAAESAADSASHGRNQMSTAVRLTQGTNDILNNSISAVRDLESKVGSIAALTSQISDISDQTNLLALNAAIEAARAGDSGRGFAVVADEVRTLSLRTHEFTTQIRKTVDELNSVATEAVKSIETGQAHSLETTSAIDETQQSMISVEDAISAVSDMNIQIASACEQQAATASEINRSIHRVTDRNASIVEEAGQLNDMARGLDATIDKLEAIITRYRI